MTSDQCSFSFLFGGWHDQGTMMYLLLRTDQLQVALCGCSPIKFDCTHTTHDCTPIHPGPVFLYFIYILLGVYVKVTVQLGPPLG